jgi:hypothetical protein
MRARRRLIAALRTKKGNAGCRQDKREDKQEGRQQARDIKY